jgi:hypothetical protein
MLSAVVHCSHPQIPASMHIRVPHLVLDPAYGERAHPSPILVANGKGKIESQTPAPVILLPPQKSALASHCEPSRSGSQQLHARLAEF